MHDFRLHSLWPQQALWALSPLCVASTAACGAEGTIHKLCLWAGSPSLTAALTPTRAVLIFPGWSDFVAENFSPDPACRGYFSPIPDSVLGCFSFKTHSCQSYSKMNKSLEITRKQREQPLARGKAGVWSYQIWFLSRIVAARAQGSGDCCGGSFFRLDCGTGVMSHRHRTSCLLCLGLSNLHRFNMGELEGGNTDMGQENHSG